MAKWIQNYLRGKKRVWEHETSCSTEYFHQRSSTFISEQIPSPPKGTKLITYADKCTIFTSGIELKEKSSIKYLIRHQLEKNCS